MSGDPEREGGPADRHGSGADERGGPGPAERHGSGIEWEVRYGYSRVVRVGDRVVVAGTTAASADGIVVAIGDPGAQARAALERIGEALERVGASLADVVRTRMYVTDAAYADPVGLVHAEAFGAAPPAATMVVVAALLDPRLLVEIEVEAVVGAGG